VSQGGGGKAAEASPVLCPKEDPKSSSRECREKSSRSRSREKGRFLLFDAHCWACTTASPALNEHVHACATWMVPSTACMCVCVCVHDMRACVCLHGAMHYAYILVCAYVCVCLMVFKLCCMCRRVCTHVCGLLYIVHAMCTSAPCVHGCTYSCVYICVYA
jgi:hypothetical protein